MSLRTRLLILVIVAMLVPAILVAVRFIQNRTSEIDAALISLSATANDISGDLDEKIQGTAQLHYGLARARDLDTNDKAACSAFLSAVREEYTQLPGYSPSLRRAACSATRCGPTAPSISGIVNISGRR